MVASCTSLLKLDIIFNTLPYVSVDMWIIQKSLPSLLSDMAWNISCNTHMNLSCIQERKISKQVRSHINYFSKQVMHKSTKIRKNPTSSTHIVMQIMQEIFLTGALSPQQLTSSVEPPMNVAPRKIWDI